MCRWLFLLAFSLALPLSLRAYTPIYTLKQILHGDPQASNEPMNVTGLNATGRLVGYFPGMTKLRDAPSTTIQAFAWDNATSTLFNIGQDEVGSIHSMATCVSSNGIVGGVYWAGGTGNQLGFLWYNGNVTTVTSPEDAKIDTIVAVNALGHAVGTYLPTNAQYKRAFFWNGNQSVDLGDLGDPQHSFIWPASLNDADLVAGTLYPVGGNQTGPPVLQPEAIHPNARASAGGGQPGQRSTPTAFRWQSGGTMVALDQANSAFASSETTGLNATGEVVGFYSAPSSGGQPSRSGFDWFDASVLDLGSLGAGGTIPFFIDEAGQVTGTSYGLDQKLHLFGWRRSEDPTVDQGLAQVIPTDTTFDLTSVNRYGDAAGFVANPQAGSLRVFVRGGRTGTPCALGSTIATPLDFTPTQPEGARALLNDAGLLACAGVDGVGQPTVVILTADADNDGLPDGWTHQYFPGGSNGAAGDDADLDGLSNLDEYLQGTDPTDFYNGQLPQLTLLGGGNQRAVAGSRLPEPVSVQVNQWGDHNAPLTFTATGGAMLAPDPSGTYQANSTITVRATGQINSDGSQVYVGQAYVYLPNTVAAVSTITATAATAGQSASISTTAVAADPNLQPPTGLDLVSNTPTTALLSFAPSDVTLPISLEISFDEGATYTPWAVANPGSTTCTLTDLPSDQFLMVRAYTGVDASSTEISQPSSNESNRPHGTSPITMPVPFTNYAKPHIVCRPQRSWETNDSFKGFQSNTRYRKIERSYVESGGYQSWSDKMLWCPDTGSSNIIYGSSIHVWVSGWHPIDHPEQTCYGMPGPILEKTIDSDTSAHGVTRYPGLDSVGIYYPYTDTFQLSLSKPFSTEDFRLATEASNPVNTSAPFDYKPGPRDEYFNGAGLRLISVPGNTHDKGFGYQEGYDLRYEIDRLQYALLVNKEPKGQVVVDTLCLPSGGTPSHAVQTWETFGATRSPVVLLDPVAINNKALANYLVTVPKLRAYGHADNPGYDGDMVPSSKTDGTGKKHFVTPKAAGGHATIEAQIVGYYDLPGGIPFDQLYRVVILQDDRDVTTSVAVRSGQTYYIKTDEPAHYVVQLQTNDAAHTVLDTLNVWVVWASPFNPDLSSKPALVYDYRVGDAVNKVNSSGIEGIAIIKFQIDPISMVSGSDDYPKLDGPNTVPAPGINDLHPLYGIPLKPGATKKWDVSRKVALKVFNSASVPLQYFSRSLARPLVGHTVPNGTLVEFSTTSAVGNDDIEDDDSNNDPYNDYDDANDPLNHVEGFISSSDKPSLVMPDLVPSISGATPPANGGIALELDFQEFVRLQIGDKWYEISDPYYWGLLLKLKLQNGVWTQNGSTIYPED